MKRIFRSFYGNTVQQRQILHSAITLLEFMGFSACCQTCSRAVWVLYLPVQADADSLISSPNMNCWASAPCRFPLSPEHGQSWLQRPCGSVWDKGTKQRKFHESEEGASGCSGVTTRTNGSTQTRPPVSFLQLQTNTGRQHRVNHIQGIPLFL